jgi:hypothetical protein
LCPAIFAGHERIDLFGTARKVVQQNTDNTADQTIKWGLKFMSFLALLESMPGKIIASSNGTNWGTSHWCYDVKFDTLNKRCRLKKNNYYYNL